MIFVACGFASGSSNVNDSDEVLEYVDQTSQEVKQILPDYIADLRKFLAIRKDFIKKSVNWFKATQRDFLNDDKQREEAMNAAFAVDENVKFLSEKIIKEYKDLKQKKEKKFSSQKAKKKIEEHMQALDNVYRFVTGICNVCNELIKPEAESLDEKMLYCIVMIEIAEINLA